jgi:lytic murein transglycosylase
MAQAGRFEANWVTSIRNEALAAGVGAATFDKIFANLTPDCAQPGVTCAPSDTGQKAPPAMPPHLRGLPQSCNRVTQPEFVHPARYFPERNLANLAVRGQSIVARWRKEQPDAYARLQIVTKETGVSLPILVALWGRETGFGTAKLRHNAVRALASLARFGADTRRDWARGQLIAALKILDEGHITQDRMASSWAGAIGLTQLTPDEFLTYAIDADGDGKRDIWGSEIDALASTANVLRHRGWSGDLRTWGYEVALPADERFDCTLEGRFTRKTFRDWSETHGLQRIRRDSSGAPLPLPKLDQEGYVVMPAGTLGPAFLVTQNFDVLRSYNTSDNYSIFVGHIADRVACDGAHGCRFSKPWPAEAQTGGFDFTVANLCKLQLALKGRGFYPGEPDGLFGGQTRVAIGRYQKSIGEKPSCFPTAAMFERLNASASSR